MEKELKKIIENETSKFKRKIPKPNGTLTGMQKSLEYISKNLKSLEKDTNKSVNEYIKSKDFNDKEISDIEKYCSEQLSNAISTFL